MYPVSAAFREVVTSGDQVAVITAAASLNGELLEDLKIDGGAVTIDGRREGPRRSLSLTVVPQESTWAHLNTPGVEIAVERGLMVAGVAEMVPLGVFVVDSDITQTNEEAITVNAADRSRRISMARWTQPYVVSAGTDVGTAIAGILTDRWPAVTVGFSTVGITTATQAVMQPGADSDPWKDARSFAEAHGYDLYFDGEGVAQMRVIPDPSTAVVNAIYQEGEASIVVSQTRSSLLMQVVNGVIATGEGTEVATVYRGEAWDDDPLSPTYRHGPMGQVPGFYSSPLLNTQAAVDAAAVTQLSKRKGKAEQLSWDLIVNPAHEDSDVIEFVGTTTRRFMLDEVIVPLVVTEAMPAKARETRAV